MYAYTMHVPAPIDVYDAMHQAVLAVIAEQGGGDGLILHLAYATDQGFDVTEVWTSEQQFGAFYESVLPEAMARAGLPMDGPQPQPVEFVPAGVMTPGAFTA